MLPERDLVLKCIYDCGADDEKLISEVNRIVGESGPEAYPVILHVLTHLDIDPVKGKKCWDEILAHRETMNRSLGRRVNLRTVICDYFCSIRRISCYAIFSCTLYHHRFSADPQPGD